MDASGETRTDYKRIAVRRVSGALGAEITGVDLEQPLDDETRDEILAAFGDHLVIYFPDQDISREAHLAFAGLFGPAITVPQLFCLPDYPDLQEIKREPDSRGRVVGESWHTDSSFLRQPPRCIVMRALAVPPYGGDTMFTNLYMAYERLSDGMKRLLEGLNAVHSATKLFGSRQAEHDAAGKRGYAWPETANENRGDLEVVHPVICTHPFTGRKFVYVNRVFTQRFEGMTEAESAPMLAFLFDHCAQLDISARLGWKKNQLLVWDNRATQHKAINDYEGFARHMERVTVEGPEPSR